MIIRRRKLLAVLLGALLLPAGCGAMSSDGSLVEHEIELKSGQPKVRVTDVVLVYGDMRPLQTPSLMQGGSGQLRRMPVPEAATVKWTDAQGQLHEEVVPIRSKAPLRMTGKRVTFEIHNDKLKVFIDTHQPNFQFSRMQIYGE
jgi:hypothetical protein